LGPHAHLSWAFDEPPEFLAAARDFLAEGLEQHLRVWYVADGDPGTLATRLHGIAGLDAALRSGAVRLMPADSPLSVAPDDLVRLHADATEAALADGYAGLRIAADRTPLVGTPDGLAAFARYEHLVDQYMALRPLSVMCGYDRARLGDDVVSRLACLHPAGTPVVEPGFRLFGSAKHSVGISGELDMCTGARFAEALRRTDPRPVDGRLVVDATRLRFLDHRTLLLLAEFADERESTLVLRTPWAGVRRMVDLLDMPSVQVEVLV